MSKPSWVSPRLDTSARTKSGSCFTRRSHGCAWDWTDVQNADSLQQRPDGLDLAAKHALLGVLTRLLPTHTEEIERVSFAAGSADGTTRPR